MIEENDVNKQWLDDERMDVLFLPFKERLSNPQSWDSKMNFWVRFIQDFCASQDLLVFNVKTLRERCRRKGKTPACLPTVLAEMKRRGLVVSLENLTNTWSDSWVSWGLQTFLAKPASWVWAKAVGQRQQEHEDSQVVLMGLVKSRAEHLVERVRKQANHPVDYILKIAELKALCADLIGQTDDNLRLLLRYLEGKRIVIIIRNPGRDELVKFACEPNAAVVAVNDVEKGVIQLKEMESSIENEIASLTRRMESLKEEARMYLAKDLRNTAKSCLRKKKALQTTLELREQNLDNVHVLLSKIHGAHTEAKIVEAYNLGVKALKSHAKQFNMSPEQVTDTIDDVSEALGEQQEITDLLSSMGREGDDTTADLEAELAALLNSDESLDAELQEELAISRLSSQLPKTPLREPTGSFSDSAEARKQKLAAALS